MRNLFTLIFILASLISFGQNSAIDDLWKLYSSQDLKSAIEKAKPLLEKDPNNIELNLIMGRSYTDQADFKNAIPYLESTVKSDNNNSWRKAWALGYLGTCHFMLEDYANSKKSTKECFDLNVTKNVTQYAYKRILLFGFDDFYKDWKIVESDNFRFHFQNKSDSDIKSYVSSREETFQNINKFFNSKLPKKIDFFVWESREDAKNLLKANLGFADPEFCIVHSHYQQTKGHEMTHVITHYLGKVLMKTGLINEGTAVYFNQKRDYNLQIVKSYMLKNGIDQINIRDVWDNWEKYNQELSYPLAGAFISKFVNKFGIEGLKKILPNQTYENSKVIFGVKLDELILNFESELKVKQTGLDTTKNDFITLIIKDNHKKGAISLNPIILLDGDQIELEGIQAMKLSKDQVKSISFLKSAAANALFGKIGEQGVIIVTTKAGLINRNFELKDSITEY